MIDRWYSKLFTVSCTPHKDGVTLGVHVGSSGAVELSWAEAKALGEYILARVNSGRAPSAHP